MHVEVGWQVDDFVTVDVLWGFPAIGFRNTHLRSDLEVMVARLIGCATSATPALYVKDRAGAWRRAEPTEVLTVARQAILEQTVVGQRLGSPDDVHDFLRVRLNTSLTREIFAVLYVDAKCRLIAFDEPFLGTLTACHVFARELVRAALSHNAASVIMAHNHVSGCAHPSKADIELTHVLRDALRLVGTSILDHVIVAGANVTSMRELGLL